MTKTNKRKVQLERVSHRAAVQRLRVAYRRLVMYRLQTVSQQPAAVNQEVES